MTGPSDRARRCWERTERGDLIDIESDNEGQTPLTVKGIHYSASATGMMACYPPGSTP